MANLLCVILFLISIDCDKEGRTSVCDMPFIRRVGILRVVEVIVTSDADSLDSDITKKEGNI